MTRTALTSIILLCFVVRCSNREASREAEVTFCENETLAFGRVLVGETSTQTVTLTNEGKETASFQGEPSLQTPFAFSGGTFPGTGGTCQGSIPVKGSCTVSIKFTPTLYTDFSLSVSLAYGTPTKTATCSITGTGARAYGILDTSFHTDGMFLTTVGTVTNNATGVAVQTDGKTLLVGGTNDTTDKMAIIRINDNGTLDTAFNTAGTLALSSPTGVAAAYDVMTYTNNRIAVFGYGEGDINDFMVAMLTSDGTLDTSFNTEGRTLTAFSAVSADIGSRFTRDADNKIIGVGTSDNGAYDIGIIRLLTDGTLDTSFNTEGKILLNLGSDTDWPGSVVATTSGNIYIAGYTNSFAGNDVFVLRYMSDGVFDTAFHTDGMAKGTGVNDSTAVPQMALQTDGKIVTGSYYSDVDTKYRYVVHRFKSSGNLDTSFHSDGKAIQNSQVSDTVSAGPVAIQTNGEILLGVTYPIATRLAAGLLRFKTDGKLDTSFGTLGMALSTIGTDNLYQGNIVIHNGRIIQAVHHGLAGFDFFFGIARYWQ